MEEILRRALSFMIVAVYLLMPAVYLGIVKAGAQTVDPGSDGGTSLVTDTKALLTFKERIDSDPLGVLDGWNINTNVNACNWYGIVCSNSRVVIVNLTNCGLTGQVPTTSLAPIDRIQMMLFGGNGFFGSLFGDVSLGDQVAPSVCTLIALDLSSNILTGTVSALFLEGCKTLTYLNVSRNLLSGTLPAGLLKAGGIKWLDLSHNNYSGPIPPDLFSNCGSLNVLDLSYNSLSGSLPSGVGSCTSLEQLNLSGNLLTGMLPKDIVFSSRCASADPANCPTGPFIRVLDLSNNHISGPLSAIDFGDCRNLSWMDLSRNALSGEIPSSLANCSVLRLLNLSANNFIGSLPPYIGNLSSIQQLYLSNNKITGVVPSGLANACGTLQELDLSSNKIIGTLPFSLSNCSSLFYLNLANNYLSGEFPYSVVSSLQSIQALILSFNNITGPMPSSLSNCTFLEVLDLSSNQLSGPIPSSFCPVSPSFKKLLLASNGLTGQIPPELGNCTSLHTLDLSINYFTGSIPSTLGYLPNLAELLMWGNGLQGEIPRDICTGGQLKKLILNVNLLSGRIPAGLANCSNMEWISLSGNRLIGPIPVELAWIKNLGMLELANNSLTGPVPKVLGNCTKLIWLDLNSNRLKGTIPPELALQSGNVTKGTLGGTQFAFLKIISTKCKGIGGLLEFSGIRSERLLSVFKTCNFTRLYLGTDPYFFIDKGSLEYLDLSYNLLVGTIPAELGTMRWLQVLCLSNNELTGSIPDSLGNIVQVTVLDLSNNKLQGRIPSSLSNLGLLNQFDLSNNQLTGSIPSLGQLSTLGASPFANNSGLCGDPLPPCLRSNAPMSPASDQGSRTRKTWPTVVIKIVVSGVVVILACILGTVICAIRTRKQTQESLRSHFIESLPTSGSGSWNISGASEPLSINVAIFEKPLRKLTFAHLLEATNGFSSDAIIGSGGFGDVYKAQLKDGSVVAIKKLIQMTGQGDREFTAEMETIGKIKHRNLVPLLGYCKVGEERLLVYEYMGGGSLEKRLHERSKDSFALSWELRKRVAYGTARGLCFLHHSCIPHIIHRDLKSSNVLLDDASEARVADFGMARLVSALDTHLSVTSLAGTPGYVPPEYFQSFRCTTKGDVYSFGVVLLELLTAQRPTQKEEFGDTNLVGWVKLHVDQRKSVEALDPELRGIGQESEMLHYLNIALRCLEDRPWKRPTMLEVLAMFRELQSDDEGGGFGLRLERNM